MKVVINSLPLGADVTELDLQKELFPEQISKLRDLIHDRGVIAIRGQKLSPAQQITFAKNFGQPEVHLIKEKILEGYPELLIVSNIIENGKAIGLTDAGSEWHTDMSYKAEPTYLSMLFALEVPHRNGVALGSTNFVSTSYAYETLPIEIKRQLVGYRAVHSFSARARRHQLIGGKEWISDEHLRLAPDVEHPVFRKHPQCDKTCIFVTKAHTTKICNMDESESSRLLEELHSHCTREAFVYRHQFKVGDLLIWDNTQTQHLATFDYSLSERRLMHRISLKGSAPLPAII